MRAAFCTKVAVGAFAISFARRILPKVRVLDPAERRTLLWESDRK